MTVWAGEWAARKLGLELHGDRLHELLGLAIRDNSRRAQLLVSLVLGKHVPQSPAVVHGTGRELGERVRRLLGDAEADTAVVLGYAETATALGHSVADGIGRVPYLHSTRRPVPGLPPYGGFEEEHSHHSSHLLLPENPRLLAGDGPLVLVDDELSTGRTLRNTIATLHRRHPRERYVIVTLTDVRGPADAAALDKAAAGLGARVDVVSLARGRVTLPQDVLRRARRVLDEHTARRPPAADAPGTLCGEITTVDLGWPAGLPDGGRHGFTPAHAARLAAALPGMAARLAAALPGGARRVLVLGSEELMYAPLRIAAALEELAGTGGQRAGHGSRDDAGDRPARPAAAPAPLPAPRPAAAPHPPAGCRVYFSSTTRSPVLPVDHPGYAIRNAVTFPAHDNPADGPGPRHAYNIAGRRWDAIVAVTDSAGDTPELHAPGGLLDKLAAHTPRVVHAVIPAHRPLPASARPLRGPEFSSYPAPDVGWLLKDLSRVTSLETPTEEKEEAIQGGRHYAEMLPVEYQPTAEYQRLFERALADSAARVAQAVATVTDTVLAERSPRPVLVSLARAGTPVGVLMRRWAQHAHGLDLPHYAVSIVRGRGIDTTALRWLAAHHDPADVVFLDGWTGKGAITRELAEALRGHPGFDPSLAVLADPGGCVSTYGTRDDFLIPSACLNSTVSGLISRTVLRGDLIGPDDFHGAKFYRDLAPADVSLRFIETVCGHFPSAVPGAMPDTPDRAPDWAGWRAVERISEEYGIGSVNLVKPGVGETTRVLLRRVPWRIVVRRGAGADLDHIRLLAEQRGVPLEEADDLPYTCVGLIHPHYTRGATGADGKAVK
ncbi:phosphoribosyltransferase [Streptomyces aidingensis]|nr:phosphoribosyltransferase [Streptomyces aidingensis]